jgi:hypothetical protein
VFGKYGLKIHPKFISFYFSQIWYETKVSLSKWVKNRVHWVHSGTSLQSTDITTCAEASIPNRHAVSALTAPFASHAPTPRSEPIAAELFQSFPPSSLNLLSNQPPFFFGKKSRYHCLSYVQVHQRSTHSSRESSYLCGL